MKVFIHKEMRETKEHLRNGGVRAPFSKLKCYLVPKMCSFLGNETPSIIPWLSTRVWGFVFKGRIYKFFCKKKSAFPESVHKNLRRHTHKYTIPKVPQVIFLDNVIMYKYSKVVKKKDKTSLQLCN